MHVRVYKADSLTFHSSAMGWSRDRRRDNQNNQTTTAHRQYNTNQSSLLFYRQSPHTDVV